MKKTHKNWTYHVSPKSATGNRLIYFFGPVQSDSETIADPLALIKTDYLIHFPFHDPLLRSIFLYPAFLCQSNFFLLLNLSRICQISQVLKIPMMTKEATCSL